MRTGLDDKDWCRGEKRKRKWKDLAAVDKNSQAVGHGLCVSNQWTLVRTQQAVWASGAWKGGPRAGMEKVHGSAPRLGLRSLHTEDSCASARRVGV